MMDSAMRTPKSLRPPRIAVVMPCYRVKAQILAVLCAIGEEVATIYVIDDACPDGTASLIETVCKDPRVRVIRHQSNLGVGAAVMSGYRAALADTHDIVVKLDGDGQMDPADLPRLIHPIVIGQADYCKGNRFFDPEGLSAMPWVRLIGNGLLSLLSKLSTGYWQLFDPNNGYTAIHAHVLAKLPLHKISQRYFFESDMLFRLGLMRAVVLDIPMPARYGNEHSHLHEFKVAPEFLGKHVRNGIKRVLYQYYLRDMSLASIQLPAGLALMVFGIGFGAWHWVQSAVSATLASAGTVMLAALPLIVGVQLILSFLAADIASQPRTVQHPLLALSPSKAA
jgi:glycosyltransferase involved in cell wall biosynthesis